MFEFVSILLRVKKKKKDFFLSLIIMGQLKKKILYKCLLCELVIICLF